MSRPVLEAQDLRVLLPGQLAAVDGIDLVVRAGEIVGLAGESGSGKTMTALSLFGLIPHGSRTQGRLDLDGSNVLTMSGKQLRALRGNKIAMIFQDPMTSLHPMLSIGKQITEHLRHHRKVGRRAAQERALDLLGQVRIPDPNRVIHAYPHQLSGGMRQRAAIAIALACSPTLLVADEPTTALDVTVQAGILRLLDRLRREEELSILIITHDLGVMSALTDRLAVMYAGRIVETGPTEQVLTTPAHPYTRGLLASLPRHDARIPLTPIKGTPPRLGAIPAGCAFHPRCPYAVASCSDSVPELVPAGPDRMHACPVVGDHPGVRS